MPSRLQSAVAVVLLWAASLSFATDFTVDTLARKLGSLSLTTGSTDAVQVLLQAYSGSGEPEGEPKNREILIHWLGAQDANPVVLRFLPAILMSVLEKEDLVLGEPVRRAAYLLIGNLKLDQFRTQLKTIAQLGEDPALGEVLRAYGKLVSALSAPERPAEIEFLKSLFVSNSIAAPAVVDAIALAGLQTQLVQSELNQLLNAPHSKIPVSAKLRLLEWVTSYPEVLLTPTLSDSLRQFVLTPESPAGIARIAAELLDKYQLSTPEIQARLKALVLASPHVPLWQGLPVEDLGCGGALSLLARRRPR